MRSEETATVVAKTHLWIHWAEIAIEHYHDASTVRAGLLTLDRGISDQGQQFSEGLSRELKAAMVTIAGAALALDALYGGVKDMTGIPQTTFAAWKKNKTPRHRVISETLRQGFDVQKHMAAWGPKIEWLFDLRDSTVHYEETFKDLAPHPTGTNTAPEHVTYSVEAAKDAVTLLLEILQTCMERPRSKNGDLVAYATDMRGTAERLQSLSAATS